MVVLAKITAKWSERGDLHASADLAVLLDELVGMAVFNKRIDDSIELLGMTLIVSCCMSGDYSPWHADLKRSAKGGLR
jgi:hypothetical protein